MDLSDPDEASLQPQLVASPDGRVTAVWRHFADDEFTIQSASTAQEVTAARIGKVTVKGPKKAKVRKVAKYRDTIKNRGDAAARGVRVRVSSRGIRARSPVVRIGAGKSRTVRLKVRPRKAGKMSLRFKVTSNNAGKKMLNRRVTVRR